MAKEDLIPLDRRTKEEQKQITTMGGKASGESRRKARDLRERFKIGLQAFTELKAKQFKVSGDDKKAELIKDIGVEVFSLLEIANNDTDAKTRLTAWDNILDRLVGKPVQENVVSASVVNTNQLTEEEKKVLDRTLKKEAEKIAKKLVGDQLKNHEYD